MSFAAFAFIASALTTFLSLLRRGRKAWATRRDLEGSPDATATADAEANERVVVAQEIGYRTRGGYRFSVVEISASGSTQLWTQPEDWARSHPEILQAGAHRTKRQRSLRLASEDFVFRTSTVWATFDPRPGLLKLALVCHISAVLSLAGVVFVALLAVRGHTKSAAIVAFAQFLTMPVVEHILFQRSRLPHEGGRVFLEAS